MWKTEHLTQTIAQNVERAMTHYEALGVEPGVNADAIREAHRELARLFHPDRCKLSNAHELMARINVAYSCLSDPEARRKYDFTNQIKAEKCPACRGLGTVLKQKGFKAKVKTTCPTCGGKGTK